MLSKWCTGILLLLIITQCSGINVDSQNAVVFTGESGSYFGYSLNLYGSRDKPNLKYVLIGAPRVDMVNSLINNTGNTYKCDPLNSSSCEPLNLPHLYTANNAYTIGETNILLEDKSNMWMGVSVVSSYTTGKVVTCGHRYITTQSGNSRDPVGLCFILNDPDSQGEVYSPCDDNGCLIGVSYYGYCMAGFTAHLLNDGSDLYLGAPGVEFFAGSPIRGFTTSGCSRGFAIYTRQDFDYLGYAITSGRILSRNYDAIVVSSPRQNFLRGGFTIFENSSDSNFNTGLYFIGSTPIGAYFGYSLLAVDLNQDGYDELLVGAPLYSVGSNPEIGQVLLYINNQGSLSQPVSILAPTAEPYSRFGNSISKLGDLNKDGFPEIAISAPFGNRMGSVYIFSGTGEDLVLLRTPVQIIRGEDIPGGLTIQGFGSSISGAVDVDSNNYNDLLIGAYISGHAFLLRSRPVISVSCSLSNTPLFPVVEVLQARAQGQTENITLGGETRESAFFYVNISIAYTGTDIPASVNFNYTLQADRIKLNSNLATRVFFIQNGLKTTFYSETVTLTSTSGLDQFLRVYIENDNIERLTAFTFDLSYNIITPSTIDFNLHPVVQNSNLCPTLQVNSDKQCGSDLICESDLVLTATWDIPNINNQSYSSILAGLVRTVNINIEVYNILEDAYNARLLFALPPGITFRRAIGENVIVTCAETEVVNGVTNRICGPLGNPLRGNDEIRIKFQLILSSAGVIGNEGTINISLSVTRDNPEDASLLYNNVKTISIPVTAEADTSIQAEASPDQVVFNRTTNVSVAILNNQTQAQFVQQIDLGPIVFHRFLLRNSGPSLIRNATIIINWPLGYRSAIYESEINYRDFLLYITGIETQNFLCDTTYINILGVTQRVTEIEEGIGDTGEGKKRRRRDILTIQEQKEILRKRRQTSQDDNQSGNFDTIINCTNSHEACIVIPCTVSQLAGGAVAEMTIESRVFQATLIDRSKDQQWQFEVSAQAFISDSYIKQSQSNQEYVRALLTINPQIIPPPAVAQFMWWILPVAIIGFFILLIPLFFLLYLCGFFKLKKSQKARLDKKRRQQLDDWNPKK